MWPRVRIARRLWRRFPLVRQYDETDCGPAALLSVLEYWGGSSTLVRLRELAGTDAAGTTLSGLARAAREVGFVARGVRGSYEALMEQRLPCIAHVVLDSGLQHYVVVYRATPTRVVVGDPGRGVHSLEREAFLRIWPSGVVLLLEPTERLASEPSPHWARWAFAYLRREESWLLQSIFLGVLFTVISLITAVFIQWTIDRFIPRRDRSLLLLSGAVLVALQLLRSAASALRQRFLVGLGARIHARMTEDFLTHLFRLPSRFFDTRRAGDIAARLEDSAILHSAALNVVGNAATDSLVLGGSLAFLFVIAPDLGWLLLAVTPAYAGLLLLFARRIRRDQDRALSAYGRLQSSYLDSLTGIEAIRAFRAWRPLAALNARLNESVQAAMERLGLTRASAAVLAELAGGVLATCVLVFGAVRVMGGEWVLGQMVAAYAVVAGVLPSVNRLVETYLSVQQASVAARRLFDLLLVEPEANPGARPFALEARLEIRNGCFQWPRGPALLAGLDLCIERGRLTGLWGPSGSGKSTIVRILERKYALAGGEVLADGIPCEAFELEDYRRNVVAVPEAAKIFNGTIADNLLLGRSPAALERLLARLHACGLSSFFDRFDAGLATVVGESGRQLSSGERQMIALARALLDEPAVLIVDEGIQTIDAEYARRVQRLLEEYAERNAVLLISHDLQLLARCDPVYVLQGGRAVRVAPADLARLDAASRLFGFLPEPGLLAGRCAAGEGR